MDIKDTNSLVDSSPLTGCATDSSVKGSVTDEISLKELILKLQEWYRYLLTRWVIIISTGIIGGGLSLAYAFFQKPVYTAELTFVLEGGTQGGGLANYAGLASQFGINMGGSGGQGVFVGENLLALMKSRLMIEKTLLTTVNVNNRRITLAEFYIDIKKLQKKWAKENPKLKDIRFLSGANPSKFTTEQNSLISSFHNALIANNLFIDKQDKKSSIIALRVNSENELFSKYFVEVLAKEVSVFYVETTTKKSADNLRILQHQTDSVRRALTISMMGAATAADENPNPNSARQVLRVPSQRRQGDVQANQAILSQLVQNLEIAKVSLRTETPLIQVIDRPILPLPVELPNPFLWMTIGLIASGVITVFILIFRKLLVDFP
jgi:hypothetical protein